MKPLTDWFNSKDYRHLPVFIALLFLLIGLTTAVMVSKNTQVGSINAYLPTFTPKPTPTPSSKVSLIIPVYNDTMVNYLENTLKPYIKIGDVIEVSSGGTGSLNMQWVNNAITNIHNSFPDNKIYGITAGLQNVKSMASQISPFANKIFYDYEPNFSNIPEFSWDFPTTVNNVSQSKSIITRFRKIAGSAPTGRPLLQSSLQQYRWNYSAINPGFEVIQTQTYCLTSTQTFQTAINKLSSEFGGNFSGWGPQITVSSVDTNGVSPRQAYDCSKAGISSGVKTIDVWWSNNDPSSFLSYLKLMRP